MASGSGSSGTEAPAAASASQHRHALEKVNSLTKWAVSAVTGMVLVSKWRDEHVMWAVLGSIVSVVICKTLKHVINQQRPVNARKDDPGMPSSHANSLSYLATYAAAATVPAYGSTAAVGIMAAALFLTWLRVEMGYHDPAQVTVGFLLGSSTALAWRELGLRAALEHVRGSTTAMAALYALTCAAVGWFGLKSVRQWLQERGKGRGGADEAALRVA